MGHIERAWRQFSEETMHDEAWHQLKQQDKFHTAFVLGLSAGMIIAGVNPLVALLLADAEFARLRDEEVRKRAENN
jgi:hypothetical protein